MAPISLPARNVLLAFVRVRGVVVDLKDRYGVLYVGKYCKVSTYVDKGKFGALDENAKMPPTTLTKLAARFVSTLCSFIILCL